MPTLSSRTQTTFRRLAAGCFVLALCAAPPALPPAGAAEQPSEHGPIRVAEIASGLENPWALAFLPEGGFLVTERPGRLRLISPEGEVGAPIAGVPDVHARGQGGLLDVLLSPNFASDRLVYLSYAEAGDGQSGTAVGRGRLSTDGSALENFTVIFRQQPKLSSGQHYGSRLVFSREGHLYVTLGDNNQRPAAQDLDKLQGKVVRLRPDGGIPKDNPYVGHNQAHPAIWSYGHRNAQGAALHPDTGALWIHEHGPRGGDEINLPQPGENYGWPLATHGINYSMLPIPEAQGKTAPGTLPPHYVWDKSPAISGMAFYTGERHPAWRGNLFIGALKHKSLIRLELDSDQRVVHEERLLTRLDARIRDVRDGPDGYLYLLTDARDGRLLRLEPGGAAASSD